ncbi:hypothetical protein PoB_007643100 [Plakobranchus ocellatus]|uniref:Uncharacterized protein n=1 Tax=Plakobranchus ocellatus TaxID=259542 RepID=A0AAV4E0T7_9GAST|nr:hypothetical protein PoB_007643100 [Plakobranchus ocellatus]
MVSDKRLDTLRYLPCEIVIFVKYPDLSLWLCIIYSQSTQNDLRCSGPLSGQGTSSGVRTSDIRDLEDLRAESLSAMPLKPLTLLERNSSSSYSFDKVYIYGEDMIWLGTRMIQNDVSIQGDNDFYLYEPWRLFSSMMLNIKEGLFYKKNYSKIL